ncbi:MAG: DUF4035 domain-containing protein [Phycisphaerae bacterium]|nr:DUF4035 domain-containing protein [Phycisphaerae bacterium]
MSAFGPIGPQRADYHAALIAYVTASIWQGKDSPRMNLEDFLLFVEKRQEDEAEVMAAKVRGLAAMLGGRVTSGNDTKA